jgi:hypothetical protein
MNDGMYNHQNGSDQINYRLLQTASILLDLLQDVDFKDLNASQRLNFFIKLTDLQLRLLKFKQNVDAQSSNDAIEQDLDMIMRKMRNASGTKIP